MTDTTVRVLEITGAAALLVAIGVASPWFARFECGLEPEKTRAIQADLALGISVYQLKHKSFPPQDRLQSALESLYEGSFTDGWGNPILYLHPKMTGAEVVLISAGPDSLFNTPDDMVLRHRSFASRHTQRTTSPSHAPETANSEELMGCSQVHGRDRPSGLEVAIP